MLGGKIVVESENQVQTGVIRFFEGDLIEVQIDQPKHFNLGDAIRASIYANTGINNFQSSVIAKLPNGIVLVNPPEFQKKQLFKRQHTRVPCDLTAYIRAIIMASINRKIMLNNPTEIEVKNVSLGGVGFFIPKGLDLQENAAVEVEFNVPFHMICTIDIMHKAMQENGVFYGGQFRELPPDKLSPLKAFTLKKQVEQLLQRRAEEQAGQ
jgi:hypothetical protein